MDVSNFRTPGAALDWTLSQLGRAAVDRRSPWRWPVLCTAPGAGRVIVLRQFDRPARRLRLYTDRRSAKVSEIRSNPQVELVFFDPGQMVQLRVSGMAAIATTGPDWEAALSALPAQARQDYARSEGPGTPIEDPETDLVEGLTAETFTLIDITFSTLRWLAISRSGHLAVTSTWTGTEYESQWVAP